MGKAWTAPGRTYVASHCTTYPSRRDICSITHYNGSYIFAGKTCTVPHVPPRGTSAASHIKQLLLYFWGKARTAPHVHQGGTSAALHINNGTYIFEMATLHRKTQLLLLQVKLTLQNMSSCCTRMRGVVMLMLNAAEVLHRGTYGAVQVFAQKIGELW